MTHPNGKAMCVSFFLEKNYCKLHLNLWSTFSLHPSVIEGIYSEEGITMIWIHQLPVIAYLLTECMYSFTLTLKHI